MSLLQNILNIGIEVKAIMIYLGLTVADIYGGFSIVLPFVGSNRLYLTIVFTLLAGLIRWPRRQKVVELPELQAEVSQIDSTSASNADELIFGHGRALAIRRNEVE